MIEKLFIPTLGRSDKQITYQNLSNKWKEKVVFVICEKEKDLEFFKDKQCLITENNIGIAKTRYQIVKAVQNENIKYGVLDDDLKFYIRKDLNKTTKVKMSDEDFEEAMILISSYLDEENVVCAGLDTCISPPTLGISDNECCRPLANVFYNSKTLPVDSINWLDFSISEDFWVMLQLLNLGLKNKITCKYYANSGASQKEGGCAEYRTLEKHNESFYKLKEKFPKYVTLKEKIINSGGFANIPQVKGIIFWKKLYNDAIKRKRQQELFS